MDVKLVAVYGEFNSRSMSIEKAYAMMDDYVKEYYGENVKFDHPYVVGETLNTDNQYDKFLRTLIEYGKPD